MKPKFKPGDVVEFVAEVRDVTWAENLCKLNHCKAFFIESYVPQPKIDTYAAVHLLPVGGRSLRWFRKESDGERQWGIWEGWLERNEFLTAVHKAQKQTNLKRKGDVSI